MKKIILCVSLLASGITFAQKAENVGIGTVKPDPSALLDLNSTSKGLLLPRMNQAQRDAIAKPAAGLVIFQTDQAVGVYTFDGINWVNTTHSNARTAISTGPAGRTYLDSFDGSNQHWINSYSAVPDLNGHAIGIYNDPATNLVTEVRLSPFNNHVLSVKGLTGRVGINNTNPAVTVDVVGDIQASSTIRGLIRNTDNRTYLGALDGSNFHWFASSPLGTDPANIAFGVNADPTTFAVNSLIVSPGGVAAGGLTSLTAFAPTASLPFPSLTIGSNTRTSFSNVKLFVDGATVIGALPGTSTLTDAGTANGYNLYVANGILTEKVKVSLKAATWADYVFDPNYELLPLSQVEKFYKANKHLPNVASAAEIEKSGLDLASTDAKLMEKIEELTIYIVDINKQVQLLKKENMELKKAIKNH